MKAVKHWGVIMYILAAFVSISVPLVLAASPGLAANLFPQAGSAEVMQAAEWVIHQSVTH